MVAVPTQYDAIAADYERLIAPRFATVARTIAAAVDLRPDDAVVDLGAGTGGLSRLLLPRLGPAGRLVLLDLSARMLDVARDVLGGSNPAGADVQLVVGDLAALPFPTGDFSQVVAQFTPLQDSEPALAEAARVLRPDGRLTIAYWGPSYRELDLLNRVRTGAGLDPAVPPDGASVAGRVTAAGFTDLRQAEHRFPASYPDGPSYLAYRAAFGRAIAVDDATWSRYWAALEAEVERVAASDGSVELDWSAVILTARRG